MPSNCKEFPSILLRSKISTYFCSSSHCTAIWSSACQYFSSSSSSFSICEHSQFCLTICPTFLSAVDLASWAISLLMCLSSLQSSGFPYFSAVFSFRASSWQPASTTTKQYFWQLLLVPFLHLFFSFNHKRLCFVRPRLKIFHHLHLRDLAFQAVTRNDTIINLLSC